MLHSEIQCLGRILAFFSFLVRYFSLTIEISRLFKMCDFSTKFKFSIIPDSSHILYLPSDNFRLAVKWPAILDVQSSA